MVVPYATLTFFTRKLTLGWRAVSRVLLWSSNPSPGHRVLWESLLQEPRSGSRRCIQARALMARPPWPRAAARSSTTCPLHRPLLLLPSRTPASIMQFFSMGQKCRPLALSKAVRLMRRILCARFQRMR